MFKLMGALKDMGKIQEEFQETTRRLAEERFTGSAGGDMVRVTASGAQLVVACTIEQSLIDDKDRELIEQLVVAAANDALAKARTRSAEMMQEKVKERFDLPGMEDVIKNLLPK